MKAVPALPRSVFGLLYVAALMVLIDQSSELVASMYPFRTSDVQWRFGAYGLIVGRTTTMVLVDIMLIVAAAGLRHRLVVRAWGLLHFLVAATILVGLTMFVLDALELRRVVRPEAATTVQLAAGRAALVALVAVVYCVWVGIAAFKGSRPESAARAEELLVVPRAGA